MSRRPNTGLLIYLGALSILGAAVLYVATVRMGPGVSTDGALVMSTAENLMRGHGLIDYRGRELTQFPPLYSLIQALGAMIFGADVFLVGWTLNVLVFAALIAGTGLYLSDAFSEEPILAYLGSFVVMTSTSLLQISANIASDPLFMLMVLAFLMVAGAYLRTGEVRWAVMAAVLTIASCFQRYAGLALVITGGLIALFAHRKDLRRGVMAAGSFMLITAAPICAWAYLHNKPYSGEAFGARLPSVPGLNFEAGVEKLLAWFVPYRIISAVGAVPLLAMLVGLCALAILPTGARRLVDRLLRPQVVPSIAFLIVYAAVLIFYISYFELKGLTVDRVHIVALPSVLMLLAVVGGQLLEAGKRKVEPGRFYGAVLAMFLVWTIYPISKSNDYVRESMAHGDVSPYNSINKGSIRDSALAHYVSTLDMEGKQVYSNGGDTVWFVTRHRVRTLPFLESDDRNGELQRLKGWPGPQGEGYILWIPAEAHKAYYATPAELTSIADITSLFADEHASVYYVTAR